MATETPLPGFTVRLLREGDLPALTAHFEASFGGWPKVDIDVTPLEHLQWKVEGYPEYSYGHVAELDGGIVAGQIHHLRRVKVGAGELRAVCGWDAAVLPERRGQGIMSQMRPDMLEETRRLAEFVFGGTTHPGMATLTDREPRHRFYHGWVALQHPFSLRAAVSSFKLRPDRSPLKLARSIASLARWRLDRAPAPTHPWTLRTIDRFDERADAFCKDACAPFDFVFVRTRDLLNWRYADRRAGSFTIRVAEQDGRLLGYAVLRVTGGVGYVADVLALPDRLDVAASLAWDSAAQLRAAGVPLAECWLLANHPYFETMSEAGYRGRRARVAPTFMAREGAESKLAFLCERDAVAHVMLGDLDFI